MPFMGLQSIATMWGSIAECRIYRGIVFMQLRYFACTHFPFFSRLAIGIKFEFMKWLR
jgi:hypothetical protein